MFKRLLGYNLYRNQPQWRIYELRRLIYAILEFNSHPGGNLMGRLSRLRLLFFLGILSQLDIHKDPDWKKIADKYKRRIYL
jgi:hypothetical protein